MPLPRLGELLVADGVLAPAAVARALGFQKTASPRRRLGSILLTWDLLDEGSLLRALAALHRCDAVTGDMLARAPEAVVRLLPQATAIRLNAIAYALDRSRIRVGFVDPTDISAIDEVASITGHSCVPGVVTELRLMQAHRRFYGRPIPVEMRPPASRRESRPRADAEPATRVSSPVWEIPILRTAAPAASDGADIRVPDIPIPPPPASPEPPSEPATLATAPEPAQAENAAEPEPDRSVWLSALPETPLSAAAEGMWSPASEAAPALPARPRETPRDPADFALAAIPAAFARAVVFTVRSGVFDAWRTRGVPASEAPSLHAAEGDGSVFASVAASGIPHVGRVDPAEWPAPFARLFDGAPCAIFPVHSGSGVVALLYADRRGAPLHADDRDTLSRAAAQVASILSRPPRTPPS